MVSEMQRLAVAAPHEEMYRLLTEIWHCEHSHAVFKLSEKCNYMRRLLLLLLLIDHDRGYRPASQDYLQIQCRELSAAAKSCTDVCRAWRLSPPLPSAPEN
jgi:hypothetical protein